MVAATIDPTHANHQPSCCRNISFLSSFGNRNTYRIVRKILQMWQKNALFLEKLLRLFYYKHIALWQSSNLAYVTIPRCSHRRICNPKTRFILLLFHFCLLRIPNFGMRRFALLTDQPALELCSEWSNNSTNNKLSTRNSRW